MNKFFAREGSKTLPLENSPMAKLYIVITPEGHPGIFSVMNHLIADSWAISSFLQGRLRRLPRARIRRCDVQVAASIRASSDRRTRLSEFQALLVDREYWRLELLEEPKTFRIQCLRRLRQFSIPIEGASCSFSLIIIELHVLKNKVPSSTMIRMSIVQSSEEDVPYLNAFSTNVIKIIGGIFTLS